VVEAAAAAAAGPTAWLAGGTSNCKSSADYTWDDAIAGWPGRDISPRRYCACAGFGVRYVTRADSPARRRREASCI
jgi:hypothetical protein